ncbi:hypothetical protein HY285_03605 [Candidatus Peregrinibacteria bacterium]|nr:hypothetical protein [Candidatus Peregrinibacteria bacterium]MBI3816601.1 hypothetical protein [Candidatus Peregrinibacteria bacterium]
MGCKVVKAIVALVLTLTTIAAIGGAWHTLSVGGGFSFGTTDASLALLTLVVSITLWLKVTSRMCPCRKGMCGGGMCPGCGCSAGECKCDPK